MFTGSPGVNLGDAVRGAGVVVFLSNDSQSAFANPEILLPTEFLTRLVVNRNFDTKLESNMQPGGVDPAGGRESDSGGCGRGFNH